MFEGIPSLGDEDEKVWTGRQTAQGAITYLNGQALHERRAIHSLGVGSIVIVQGAYSKIQWK